MEENTCPFCLMLTNHLYFSPFSVGRNYRPRDCNGNDFRPFGICRKNSGRNCFEKPAFKVIYILFRNVLSKFFYMSVHECGRKCTNYYIGILHFDFEETGFFVAYWFPLV